MKGSHWCQMKDQKLQVEGKPTPCTRRAHWSAANRGCADARWCTRCWPLAPCRSALPHRYPRARATGSALGCRRAGVHTGHAACPWARPPARILWWLALQAVRYARAWQSPHRPATHLVPDRSGLAVRVRASVSRAVAAQLPLCGKSAPSVVASHASKSLRMKSSFFRASSSAIFPSSKRKGGVSERAASMMACAARTGSPV